MFILLISFYSIIFLLTWCFIHRIPFALTPFSQSVSHYRLQYNHTTTPQARNQACHSLRIPRSPSTCLLRRNRANPSIYSTICYPGWALTSPRRTSLPYNTNSTLLHSCILHSSAGIWLCASLPCSSCLEYRVHLGKTKTNGITAFVLEGSRFDGGRKRADDVSRSN